MKLVVIAAVTLLNTRFCIADDIVPPFCKLVPRRRRRTTIQNLQPTNTQQLPAAAATLLRFQEWPGLFFFLSLSFVSLLEQEPFGRPPTSHWPLLTRAVPGHGSLNQPTTHTSPSPSNSFLSTLISVRRCLGNSAC